LNSKKDNKKNSKEKKENKTEKKKKPEDKKNTKKPKLLSSPKTHIYKILLFVNNCWPSVETKLP